MNPDLDQDGLFSEVGSGSGSGPNRSGSATLLTAHCHQHLALQYRLAHTHSALQHIIRHIQQWADSDRQPHHLPYYIEYRHRTGFPSRVDQVEYYGRDRVGELYGNFVKENPRNSRQGTLLAGTIN
jgi:hypothetical protein